MRKKIFSFRRCLMVLAILCAIAGVCLSFLRLYSRLSEPARPQPDPAVHSDLTARYLEDEELIAVTQTMTVANRTGEDWPDLMIQLPANAYASEELSPAASAQRFPASYPRGFSTGWLALDWAEADGRRTEPALDGASALSCLLPVSVPAGGTVTLRLRYRLYLPDCLHRFGRDSTAVRLFRVFPALGIREAGRWVRCETSSVGDGWNAPVSGFSFSFDLPEGCALAAGCQVSQAGNVHSGVLPAADDLCLCIWQKTPARVRARAGQTSLTVFSADGGTAREVSSLLAPYMRRLTDLYGPSPLDSAAVCVLSYGQAFDALPGVIVLSEDQLKCLDAADAAWCAAMQWFGAGFSTDGFREAWLSAALSEWAAQQALRLQNGSAALEERRSNFVEESMRENPHLSLTPGSPLSLFPDDAVLESFVRGRGCAFLIAADTMSGGKFNRFLRELAGDCFARRFGEEELLTRLNQAFGMDFSPLLTDYIHTLITGKDCLFYG